MSVPLPPSERWEFEAIGTRWRIDTAAQLGSAERESVTRVIDGFDSEWSRFRADSLVASLARGERAAGVPADARAMLELYVRLDEATGGAVNPLVGDALARRGYDRQYSFVDAGAAGSPVGWQKILRWSAGRLELDVPALIDVGAVGKGRLVDLVSVVVGGFDGGAHVVDAGGDMRVAGTVQRVGLEHPYDTSRVLGVWRVADAALCASAVNRRAWGDGLHHVLDARTGEPVRRYAATWAVAADAMTADAVATALFFDGGPRFAAEHGAAWVRMRTDGPVDWSPDCEVELFL